MSFNNNNNKLQDNGRMNAKDDNNNKNNIINGDDSEIIRINNKRKSEYGALSATDNTGHLFASFGRGPSIQSIDINNNCLGRRQLMNLQSTGSDDDLLKQKQQTTFVERLARHVPGLGIIFSLISSLFLGTAGMLVKKTLSVHGIQVAVFRAVIQFVIYGFVVYFRRIPLLPKQRSEWLPTSGRAILSGVSITMSYHALKLIPLGDATTIRFSLPIWTLIIGYFILGESLSKLKIFAVIICISGVVLITKPDDCIHYLHLAFTFVMNLFGCSSLSSSLDVQMQQQRMTILGNNSSNGNLTIDQMTFNSNNETTTTDSIDIKHIDSMQQLEGCLLALASSICLSMSLICLRMCKQTPSELTILWVSIASIVFGTITLLALGEFRMPNNVTDVVYILLNGLCGSIGQWFITNALKIEQSGIIALARTFDIEVAFFYSALLLHEVIRPTSIIGSVLVSSGVVAVVLPKWLQGRSIWSVLCCRGDGKSDTDSRSTDPNSGIDHDTNKTRSTQWIGPSDTNSSLSCGSKQLTITDRLPQVFMPRTSICGGAGANSTLTSDDRWRRQHNTQNASPCDHQTTMTTVSMGQADAKQPLATISARCKD